VILVGRVFGMRRGNHHRCILRPFSLRGLVALLRFWRLLPIDPVDLAPFSSFDLSRSSLPLLDLPQLKPYFGAYELIVVGGTESSPQTENPYNMMNRMNVF
jgi:hypothetical protein